MKLLKYNKVLAKYKLMMEDTREMILFFNFHGRIIECNDRAMKELGYGDDIYQLSICEIFKKAFLYQDKKLNLDPKYKSNSEETIAYRKNQTCFPVSLKVNVDHGKKDGVGSCCALNISEYKEASREIRNIKNELKNMDQLSTELLANVTHELKTPINGILGFSNSLLNTELTTEQIEDINIIKRCCTNMNSIINDILDYSKITNSKLELEQRSFHFRDFINQIIEINSIQINEKGLKLLVDISDEIPDILAGDELRLSQVLNNLFSNAVKFTSFGQIGLEVTKINETDEFIELFFMIFDTGIGISPEEKDRLFKSFSQVDSSITRRFGGTGLGLSICKKLIEAMGGSIQVDSEKNKGSVFTFSVRMGLPRAGYMGPDYSYSQIGTIIEEEPELELDRVENNLNVSEIDYINMRLQDSSSKTQPKPNHKETMKEVMVEIASIMEKLVICIEMENWSKAEELITGLKKTIPQDHSEISKNVLRLLLAVRKENHDNSLSILKELKEGIFKEK